MLTIFQILYASLFHLFSFHVVISGGFSDLVFPLGGRFRVLFAESEPSVLLAVDVLAAGGLDAHSRGISELQKEGLGCIGIGGSAVLDLDVFSILS